MPFTDAQIQTLRDALASGVRRVKFGDRELEFRSAEELKIAIAAAEADIAKNSGNRTVRQIRISTQKGL
jgi:hypothetical protein